MIDIIGPSNINYNYLNASFVYSQLLKEVLLDIHTEKETDRRSFIEHYYKPLSDNTIIDLSGIDYKKHSPIHCYSINSSVFNTVNQALRTVNVDLLVKMTFFIGDLHKQIKELHSKVPIKDKLVVFRGQALTKRECKKLETSIGGFISFNCFLSTSTKQDISKMFAESNSSAQGCNGVLFEIEIDPEISSSPFASIKEYSQFPEEHEILFSTHTIFRIDRVTVQNDGLYYVHLSLTNGNHDKNLYELLAYRRKEIEGQTCIHRLAQLLYRMGKFQHAKHFFQILRGTTFSWDEIFQLSHYIARIDCQIGDLKHATAQQAIAMQFYAGRNPALTADIYVGMAEIFLRSDMLEDSLELYKRAYTIAEQSPTINDHSKVLYLNNIGFVLNLQKNYDQALAHFEKALDIAVVRFPSTHPDIANTYQNIGSLYFDKRDFKMSIDYLKKSFDIQEVSLPSDHPSMGYIHYNLSKVYVELNQCDEAIHHSQLAIDILKKSFSDDHPEIRKIQGHHDAVSVVQRWKRSSDTSQHRAFEHLITQLVIKMMEDDQ
ncbi:unnamed protein product [Adineta ricciae]|nr:unnamed protein product [Adineta ricciae]